MKIVMKESKAKRPLLKKGGRGEVAEEVATETKEASENVALLKRGVEALEKLSDPQAERSFTKFIL